MAKTSFQKGLELENQFSTYMKEELKYRNTRVRASIHGSMNPKGTEVDILGVRADDRGRKYKNIALIYSFIFIICLTIGILENIDALLYFSIFIEVLVLVAFFLSRKFGIEHAWVECKNLKTKVNINHISKTVREIEDYKRSGNKEYKLNELIFVSANGFVENALKYAIEHGMRCFEKNNKKKFVELKYWN